MLIVRSIGIECLDLAFTINIVDFLLDIQPGEQGLAAGDGRRRVPRIRERFAV